jgi:nitric oxide reductase NorD protein
MTTDRAEAAIQPREALDLFSSTVALNQMREVLRLYCRALSGRDVSVEALERLVEKNIGWSRSHLPTTDGATIYLPSIIDKFATNAENSEFLRVILTCQLGHIEFGGFNFSFARPSTKFRDLRLELSAARCRPGEKQADESAAEAVYATDISRFFRLFPEPRLALDIFTALENFRIEARIMCEYRGLAAAYRSARSEALGMRPEIIALPAREALIEFIIRISLGQTEGLLVPARHGRAATRISCLLRLVSQYDATVEDSAEATLRIYSLLSEAINNKLAETQFTTVELDHDGAAHDNEKVKREEILRPLLGGNKMPPGAYAPPKKVDYRGEFKHELTQLLAQFPAAKGGQNMVVTERRIMELLQNAPELQVVDADQESAPRAPQAHRMRDNLLQELARHQPQSERAQRQVAPDSDDDGALLEALRPGTFVYDEWDFCAGAYKPRWCLVQEKPMAYGDQAFYRQTLFEHAALARQIQHEFEQLMPEMHRKVKRLEDGEEHDLDALIEAVTDLRIGVTPSEKLFWRRNKSERSVAVALLLDMSASTAEPIDEAKHASSHRSAWQQSVQVPTWPHAQGTRTAYKRVIDVAKEGIVLLVNALETLGDQYGIYGFSGYGRENVEFYLIKELAEEFSADIPKRIDRIAPVHTTRMGPAIRHAASKLKRQEARSKFLFLISDGRPQDRGYSRDGVEKEYAVHDTRMALIEARREGITPFCLTVDKRGADYLRTMMDDFVYEVLPDVSLLPHRLPRLYKILTS